jgi:hypothetical protein
MNNYPKARYIENVFTKAEINQLIDYFAAKPVAHRHEPAKTANKNLDYDLHDSLVYQIVRPKLAAILDDPNHKFFAGAYKEYEVPYPLHIDNTVPTASQVFESDKKHKTAFLIPLMEGEDLYTAMFDVFMPVGHSFKIGTTDEDKVKELRPFLHEITSGINLDMFDHIEEPFKSMLPYIPVDKIQKWKLGSVITWHFDQLHCSTNFAKHGITKKFMVIMIN